MSVLSCYQLIFLRPFSLFYCFPHFISLQGVFVVSIKCYMLRVVLTIRCRICVNKLIWCWTKTTFTQFVGRFQKPSQFCKPAQSYLKIRPDTWQKWSRAVSLLGRGCNAETARKTPKKQMRYQRTNQLTDGPTQWLKESRAYDKKQDEKRAGYRCVLARTCTQGCGSVSAASTFEFGIQLLRKQVWSRQTSDASAPLRTKGRRKIRGAFQPSFPLVISQLISIIEQRYLAYL